MAIINLLSQSAAYQHCDLRNALPLAARCLATAASHLAAGFPPAASEPAHSHRQHPGLALGECRTAAAPCWRGFAAAAEAGRGSSAPGPSPAKLRAVPFTVTREGAVREYEAYHSSNWLFKQPSNGAQTLGKPHGVDATGFLFSSPCGRHVALI